MQELVNKIFENRDIIEMSKATGLQSTYLYQLRSGRVQASIKNLFYIANSIGLEFNDIAFFVEKIYRNACK